MADGNRGAPKSIIDWELVDYLLECDCSGAEIASRIGINKATLYDRTQTDKGILFSEYSQRMKEKGDTCLKAKQFEKALEKDNTMMIWLGKQRLKQREPTAEVNTTAPNEETLILKDQISKALYKIEQLENAIKSKANT